MRIKHERMFVSKEFKTFFKSKAAKENMTIIDYSKVIANNPNKLLNEEKTIVKKSNGGRSFESIF